VIAMSSTTGFNDPTAQRLERIATGAEPHIVGPLFDAARFHLAQETP
jgi:hypothetical protein